LLLEAILAGLFQGNGDHKQKSCVTGFEGFSLC